MLGKQGLPVRVHFEAHSLFFVSAAFSVGGKRSILVLSGLVFISLSFLISTIPKESSPQVHHWLTLLTTLTMFQI